VVGRKLHNYIRSDLMASANKTANLGLSQWEAGEGLFREDLNADFAKIDEALGNAGAGCIKPELLIDYDVAAPNAKLISIPVKDMELKSYSALWLCAISGGNMIFRFGNGNVEIPCKAGDVYLAMPLGMDRMMYIYRFGREGIQVYDMKCQYSHVDYFYFYLSGYDVILSQTKLQFWGIK